MADARIEAETFARGVAQTEIPLPWRSFLDRDEGGTTAGWLSMFCARISTDLNRPSVPMRCWVSRSRSAGTDRPARTPVVCG